MGDQTQRHVKHCASSGTSTLHAPHSSVYSTYTPSTGINNSVDREALLR